MITELKAKLYRLLRRSEKFTGTDNVYLAKGGFFLTFAQGAASLSSLALAILFARFVPKADYGIYQYLLSWGSIFALASLTGMSDALIASVARGHGRSVYVALRTRLRWSLLGFGASVIVGGYYLLHGRIDFFAGLLLVGAAMPIQNSLSIWSDYLVGRKRFDLMSRFSAGIALVMAAIVGTTILLAPEALILLASLTVGYVLVQCASLLLTLKILPPEGEAEADLVSVGKRFTVIDVLGGIPAYLDRIIVFTFIGAAPTAVYAFATAVPEQIKGIIKNLYSLALPKVAARPIPEIRGTFFRKMFLMTGAVAGIVAAYILIAPYAYALLFPKYLESVRLSQWFAVSLVAVAAVLPQAVFNGHKKIAENMRYQAATAIVAVLSLTLMTWRWGLPGAIGARILTRFFGLAYSCLLVRKIFKESSPEAPPSRTPDHAAAAGI